MNQHISEKAKIGQNVTLGYNTIVCKDAFIGEDCVIGHNVVIHAGSIIGKGCRIDDNTIIGKKPLTSPRSIFKQQVELKPAVIGDFCQIGANVIIYAQCTLGNKNLVADLATIRENVSIGELNIIGRNATIENYCEIGSRNKFETNCYITAYSKIEDYCFIAPCVATSNDNYMGRDAERFKHFKGVTIRTGGRIGVNSTILPGKVINPDGMVAGGSVVTRDVPENTVVLGSPAKPVGEVTEAQRLNNNLDK
jgi:UDP-2-acetamido-3-amino-2,3-dideoxy-glucuronate N-acetyltransferase